MLKPISCILFCLAILDLSGQNSPVAVQEGYVGVESRLIDRAVNAQVSYFHFFNEKWYGYTLRMGAGSYEAINEEEGAASTSGASIWFRQTNSYFFVKPGFICAKTNNPRFNTFGAVNVVMALSSQKLSAEYNDPVFGKVWKNYNGNGWHSGVELENTTLVNITKRLRFSLSLVLGVKLVDEDCFDEVIHNIAALSSYAPAMGYGDAHIYLNIAAGLSYKVWKRDTK